MESAKVELRTSLAIEETASRIARDRARSARWDLDIAIFLFVVLIIVIILLFEKVDVLIVSSIAVVGLVLVWLLGWRRGNHLYDKFHDEELARLKAILKVEQTSEETLEERVQKELKKRLQ